MRLIACLPTNPAEPKVEHRSGRDLSKLSTLPAAALLIIDETADGIFLIRYSAKGDFAGDTWHQSVNEAQAQAAFEFGTITWAKAPATPAVPHDLALEKLANRKAAH